MEMVGGSGGGGVRQVCVQPVVRLMGEHRDDVYPYPGKKPLGVL